VDAPPDATVEGFATILTVGACAWEAATRTVVDALAGVFPATPAATAVYVTVAVGVTTFVPPAAGIA
jgi:sorbitol-specific phosphotransferase system component IIC